MKRQQPPPWGINSYMAKLKNLKHLNLFVCFNLYVWVKHFGILEDVAAPMSRSTLLYSIGIRMVTFSNSVGERKLFWGVNIFVNIFSFTSITFERK